MARLAMYLFTGLIATQAHCAPAPLLAKANATLPTNFRDGTFRFETPSKKICAALYSGMPGAAIAAARSEGNWIEVAEYTIAANCGADVGYYLLGEAAERIGYKSAALSYFQEASRIASTASFRLSEHCTLNKGGTGFQNAGPGCFGIPIESASRDAVLRVQMTPTYQRQQGGLAGPVTYIGYTGSQQFPVYNIVKLNSNGNALAGSAFMQIGVFSGDAPVTGSYDNGQCSITRKKQVFRGPCDKNEFSGFIYDAKGKQGEQFRFRTEAYLAQIKASRPPAAPAAAASGQATSVNTGVWSLGRVRFLVEPTRGCLPQAALGTRSYCFNESMDWLRRHPEKQSVDVVAMQNTWQPGSFIPHNNGQGWDIYNVSKKGDAFVAEKRRHYGTKVQVPQGCIFDRVFQDAWYITVGGRGKVAVEASEYACANGWSGNPIYARNMDSQDVDSAASSIMVTDLNNQSAATSEWQPTMQSESTSYSADSGMPLYRQQSLNDGSLAITGEPDPQLYENSKSKSKPKPKPIRKN